MKHIKIILISTICYFFSLSMYAQTSTIVVKAQASEGDRIKIRWIMIGDSATKNANVNDNLTEVWTRYIKNGFIVERRRSGNQNIERIFTVKPDETKLADGMINSLLTQEERDACKVMKKCIFGTKNSLFSKPQDFSFEQEVFKRYFYTLASSAMSFKASCYAGLALVDDSIEPSTSTGTSIIYEYTIKEAIPPVQSTEFSTLVTIENVVLLLNTNANVQKAKQSRTASGQRMAAMLEEPPLPIAKFRNKKVELKWRWRKPNAETSHQGLYYGYYVERASEPNLTTFKRVNSVPLVGGSIDSDTLYFIDQDTTKTNLIIQNGKKYVYRLVGKTYFDDEVLSTKTVTGKCIDDSPYYPYISKESLSETKEVELTWELPKSAPMYHFKKYAIGRSESLSKDSTFNKIKIIGSIDVSQKYIDSSKRTAKVIHSTSIKNTTQSAYYVVIGITESDEPYMSDPVLVQGVDSLPPKIPANVQAVWNATSKTATITWIPNSENEEESDLLGYKIYKSLPGGIPIAISDTAVNKKRTYIDTVKVANLKVLYYVSAIDKMYNPSKLSEPGILRIPDNDPPIKPTFGNFKINSQGQVELNIYPSPSTDVASHELRRNIDTQIASLNNWTTPEKPSSYTDTGLTSGGKVSYIIEAIDSTGNKSSDTLEVDIPSILIAKPQFTLLNSSASRIDPSIKLNWDYTVVSSSNEVREFVLLKSNVSYDPSGKLGTWKTVSGDTREISDFDVLYELTYKYGVKAIFKDGSSSTWLYTTLTMPTVCGAARDLEERGVISAGANVLKEACDSIRLLPGFHAPQNSVFHAIIKKK
jgi:uncharacterized protein